MSDSRALQVSIYFYIIFKIISVVLKLNSHIWSFHSDGAGRTGTYCLIDMVLNRMTKGAKEIDIAATLEHIRDQRPDMVATKQQFEFVLMAVAEEVHAILKALPVSSSEKSVTATGSSPPTKSEQWS